MSTRIFPSLASILAELRADGPTIFSALDMRQPPDPPAWSAPVAPAPDLDGIDDGEPFELARPDRAISPTWGLVARRREGRP